ncbi:hypothetical protein IQ266_09060 [filamentous cyanobacterium LEGE 11480]|uniref:Uncharacterized protein n=1 Tax=Romeriopsis navalis LEGE 11480 TaxID=2777977 RepID=A0A928VPU0_9CYAN|nr:hypothetical protein [Romeriopsis navalis]MBE9029874.1 hypothetical protein [Romeriopsis navalis LEGE 11480]
MTQNASSESTVLERTIDPLIEASPAAPQPEHSADYLMDEIFGEVEQVLDGSLIPPDEPVKIEFKDPSANFDIAAALADRYPQLAQKLEESNLPDLPGPEAELTKVEKPIAQVPAPAGGLSLFERFMIFTGCASAVAALAVWMVSQGFATRTANFLSRKFANPNRIAATAPLAASVNRADVQFSEYVLRSLAAIDRDAAANPELIAKATDTIKSSAVAKPAKAAESSIKLPSPTPTSLKLAPSSTKPKTTTVKPVAKAATPKPVAAPQRTDLVTRTEMNQVMNRIVSMLERVAPGVSNRLPIAAKPATQVPSRAAAVKAKAAPKAPSNGPKRRISGVVEWGEKSVVTIEFNGATQRVYLGDSVGSTGWTLVEVKDSKATFRKNGEFRTLADGESF